MASLSYQKVFNATSLDTIRGLVLRNTGGYVYEDTVNSKPSVVFRATNSALANALTINVLPGNLVTVLELAFAPNATVDGQYTLDIFVPTNSMQYLQTNQGGDTVVAPRVFRANASTPLSISSFGTGAILVDATRLVASRLTIESRGSSRVQVNVGRTIAADSIDLSTSTLGSIALMAPSTTTKQFSAVSAGAGSVFVGTPNTNNSAASPVSLNATNVVAKTYGDGNVFFMDAGTCHGSDVQTSGHGSVYMHRVPCQNTNALVLGTGNMYLATAGMLRVQDDAPGAVYASAGPNTKVTGPVLVMPMDVAVPAYVAKVASVRSARAVRLVAKNTTARPVATAPTKAVSGDATLWVFLVLVPLAVLFVLFVVRKIRAKRAIQTQLKAFAEATTPVSVNQVVLHL